MRLYLVRHGKPEDKDYEAEGDNDDPGLSDEGVEAIEALAQRMIDDDDVPCCIYSSPRSRTQETADVLHKAFTDAGYVLPPIKPDVTVGPDMSVKGLIMRLADDDDASRPMIVSHHETIGAGMRVLDRPDHPDPMAMGELRVLRVKRKDGAWKEKYRVIPSDLGQEDNY